MTESLNTADAGEVAADDTREANDSCVPAAGQHTASLLLAELKAKAKLPSPEILPDRLAWSQIKTLPALFQARGHSGLDQRHVQELIRGLKLKGELAPVLVTWIGMQAYLVDGHHRVAAYQNAQINTPFPVEHFKGTVEEAVLEAGRANSMAKLPMTSAQRSDYAWALVLLDAGYSIKATAEAAGVSARQVATMRKAKKTLEAVAYEQKTWAQAQRAQKGIVLDVMDDDEREAQLEEQANRYADRMRKEFTDKLASNTDMAARTFAIYFGSNLKQLVRDLEEHVGFVWEDPEADF